MQISHSLENLIDAFTRPTDAWVIEKLSWDIWLEITSNKQHKFLFFFAAATSEELENLWQETEFEDRYLLDILPNIGAKLIAFPC